MVVVKVAAWQVWVCHKCDRIVKKNVPTLDFNIVEHLWLNHRLIDPATAAFEGRMMEEITVMIKP